LWAFLASKIGKRASSCAGSISMRDTAPIAIARFRLASAVGTAAPDAISGHIGGISLGLNNRVPIEGKISRAWRNR
jgi:hypothetical protein